MVPYVFSPGTVIYSAETNSNNGYITTMIDITGAPYIFIDTGGGGHILPGFSSATGFSEKMQINGGLRLLDAQPTLVWRETDAAADNRQWKALVASERWMLTITNDADSVATTVMSIDRTGTVVDNIDFNADTRIRAGKSLYVFEAGNTNYLVLVHDGSNGKFSTNFGGIILDAASGVVRGGSGDEIRAYAADNTNYIALIHDGANGKLVNTLGDILLDATTGIIRGGNGDRLRLYDAGGTKTVDLYHDGTNVVFDASVGVFMMMDSTYIRSGNALRAYNGANSQYITVYHDGAGEIATDAGGIRIYAAAGDVTIRSGNTFAVLDSTNTDQVRLSHDGTEGLIYSNTNFSLESGDAINPFIYVLNGTGIAAFNTGNTNSMTFQYGSGDGYIGTTSGDITLDAAGGNVRPTDDGGTDLGSSIYRWQDVWATNGTIQTSDERQKEDILPSDLGLEFLLKLNPVKYKWKDTDERSYKRTHYGFIAQEVEKTLKGKDFAGLIIDQESGRYGLRYNEFFAIVVKAIQELREEVILA